MAIKSQLINDISKELTHLPEKVIATSIHEIIEYMSLELSNNDKGRIEVRGFGSFCLHARPPRLAHNPKTGEKLYTKPKYAVHFKPGKELREEINAARHLPIQESLLDDQEES